MKAKVHLRAVWRCAAAAIVGLLMAACTTPTNVSYFQDAALLDEMAVQQEQQLRLHTGDKVNIVVNSSNPMLQQQFTLMTAAGNTLGSSGSPDISVGRNSNNQAIAYTVDEQGTIDFPVLGRISVGGKTRRELALYLQERLIERDLVTDPIVTVEYVNMGVNVLGEVNKAGRIDITKDRFTIVDAIAAAGDLTIYGVRERVMVNRQVDGVNRVYYVDLTNMQTTLASPVYYLRQNDLIYVAPNNKRKREAYSAGNTFNTPAVWISIASLLTTITALIVK